MSWSIITRAAEAFVCVFFSDVFFFPSATTHVCYYPVAIDLSASLSIYYYVLIRCCDGGQDCGNRIQRGRV